MVEGNVEAQRKRHNLRGRMFRREKMVVMAVAQYSSSLSAHHHYRDDTSKGGVLNEGDKQQFSVRVHGT